MQLLARMAEAVRKDYWDAPATTHAQMAQRWQELAAMDGVSIHEAAARDFLDRMARGYGTNAGPAETAASGVQQVQGRVLAPVPPPAAPAPVKPRLLLGLSGILALIGFGIFQQNPLNPFAAGSVTVIENPGTDDMRITIKEGETLQSYEASDSIGEGQGVRAGITYRLDDGRMIYVPKG